MGVLGGETFVVCSFGEAPRRGAAKDPAKPEPKQVDAHLQNYSLNPYFCCLWSSRIFRICMQGKESCLFEVVQDYYWPAMAPIYNTLAPIANYDAQVASARTQTVSRRFSRCAKMKIEAATAAKVSRTRDQRL